MCITGMSRAQPGIVCARERLLFIVLFQKPSIYYISIYYISVYYISIYSISVYSIPKLALLCQYSKHSALWLVLLGPIPTCCAWPCNLYTLQSICLAIYMPCNLYGAERRDASKLGDIRCRALWQETLAMKMGDSHRSASREEAGEK